MHTKYWGYGIDNDAKNILTPLRNQYEATQKKLVILTEQMYGCIETYLMQTILNDAAGIVVSKDLFARLALTYQEIKDHHSQEIQRILKNPQKDDKERIEAYKIKLKNFLAETYHDELVGLLRFTRTEADNYEQSNARDILPAMALQQGATVDSKMDTPLLSASEQKMPLVSASRSTMFANPPLTPTIHTSMDSDEESALELKM